MRGSHLLLPRDNRLLPVHHLDNPAVRPAVDHPANPDNLPASLHNRVSKTSNPNPANRTTRLLNPGNPASLESPECLVNPDRRASPATPPALQHHPPWQPCRTLPPHWPHRTVPAH